MDPPHIKLMDTSLKLDPDIAAAIARIQEETLPGSTLERWLEPDWSLSGYAEMLSASFEQLPPDLRLHLSPPLPPGPPLLLIPPASPAYSSSSGPIPAPGPDTPRAADFADLKRALYADPVVQGLVRSAHGLFNHELHLVEQSWKTGGTGARVAIISVSGVIAGAAVTALVASKPLRLHALQAIDGYEIAVPKVPWLSVAYVDKGGKIAIKPGLAPGAEASVQVQQRGYQVGASYAPPTAGVKLEAGYGSDGLSVHVTVDVPKAIKAASRLFSGH